MWFRVTDRAAASDLKTNDTRRKRHISHCVELGPDQPYSLGRPFKGISAVPTRYRLDHTRSRMKSDPDSVQYPLESIAKQYNMSVLKKI